MWKQEGIFNSPPFKVSIAALAYGEFLAAGELDLLENKFFNQLTHLNNILHICVGWAWVIFNFLTMILVSQSLVFR